MTEISKKVYRELAEIRLPDTQKPLMDKADLKMAQLNSSRLTVEIAIPVELRHQKHWIHQRSYEVLRNIEGVDECEIKLGYQIQKNSAEKANQPSLAGVRKIIAVASGKGGVGKSTVAANLVAALNRAGNKVGLMDLDIYGPSMNMMFGVKDSPEVDSQKKLRPVEISGIKIVSMAMFTDEESAVIWRGPMVSQMVQNFLFNVKWGDLDFLILDLPPGTGDVQLTLTQSAPLTGAVIVTTPQEVSLLDVKRAVKMFDKVSVPVLGIVENMSFFRGDDGKSYYPFGSGGGKKISQALDVPFFGELPMDARISQCGDEGIPMVWKYPESEVSTLYMKLVQDLGVHWKSNSETGIPLIQYDYSWDAMPRAV